MPNNSNSNKLDKPELKELNAKDRDKTKETLWFEDSWFQTWVKLANAKHDGNIFNPHI